MTMPWVMASRLSEELGMELLQLITRSATKFSNLFKSMTITSPGTNFPGHLLLYRYTRAVLPWYTPAVGPRDLLTVLLHNISAVFLVYNIAVFPGEMLAALDRDHATALP